MNNALSIIITFHNEGDNVKKTLQSIKETVTGKVCILLVDDCSTDNYNYELLATQYGADYHKMSKQCGTIGTRTYGVSICKTEKFVFLDGHMQFYHKGWDEKLVKLMNDYPKSIITSRTVVILEGNNGEWLVEDKNDPEHHGSQWASYISLKKGQEFEPKWSNRELRTDDERVNECSCVLGAVYAITKTWWNEIDGLNGFVGYGLDESLLSIKTWMMGGQCLIVRDWGVGHLYRAKRPKTIPVDFTDRLKNKLVLFALFIPKQLFACMNDMLWKFGEMRVSPIFSTFIQTCLGARFDFLKRCKYDFDYFLEINKRGEWNIDKSNSV